MTVDREFFRRDGMEFDKQNVDAAARHSYPRNRYLQAQCKSWEAAAEIFVSEVLKRITDRHYELGAMQPIYNAWFVVDDSQVVEPGSEPRQVREVNFFVRPGREPELFEATQ